VHHLIHRFRLKYGLRFSPREDHRCRQLARLYLVGDHFQRIYHYHIRKTGGTSINHMLLGTAGRPGYELYNTLSGSPNLRIVAGDKVFVGWNRRLIEQGYYHYAFSHIPAHQIKIPARTFTITCIRNPFQRLMSHYNMLMDYKTRDRRRTDLQVETNWLGNGFADFIGKIPPQHLMRQLYMFSARYDVSEAFDRIVNCSQVLFTDSLVKDTYEMSQKLKLDLEPPHTRRSSMRPQISPAERDLAHIALAPELQLYTRLKKHRQALEKPQP